MIKPTADRFLFNQFAVFSFILLSSIFIGLYNESIYVLAVPFVLLFFYLAVADTRLVYFFFIASIPISVAIDLPGGFGTDLPGEPIMGGLMIIFFANLIKESHHFYVVYTNSMDSGCYYLFIRSLYLI